MPFKDTFDHGLDPHWTVLDGNTAIVDGRLASTTGQTTIQIGDNSLCNYTLQFDIYGGYAGGASGVTAEFANTVQFVFGFSTSEWDSIQNGQPALIAPSTGASSGHPRLVIKSPHYELWDRGNMMSQIDYGGAVCGPLLITFIHDRRIDNVEIDP